MKKEHLGMAVVMLGLAVEACSAFEASPETDTITDAGGTGDDAGGPDGGAPSEAGTDGASAGARRVFVTEFKNSGKLPSGVTGVDAVCTQEAKLAGLQGDYKAWLSTAAESAAQRVAATAGPFVLTDGQPLSPDLTLGFLARGINAGANGKTITTPGDSVWTGTTKSGMATLQTCADWTDASATGTAGRLANANDGWTNAASSLSCSTSLRFYCVEMTP